MPTTEIETPTPSPEGVFAFLQQDPKTLKTKGRILWFFLSEYKKDPKKLWKLKDILTLSFFSKDGPSNLRQYIDKLTHQSVLYKPRNGLYQLHHSYVGVEEKQRMVKDHLANGNGIAITTSEGKGFFPSVSVTEEVPIPSPNIPKTIATVTSNGHVPGKQVIQKCDPDARHVRSIIERMEKSDAFGKSDIDVMEDFLALL